MSGEPRTLTHSVDIDLVGVAKLKSVSPEPSDQGVINGETTILRFRVQDGERITLDMGRRQVEVVVNRRAGGGYPVAARDEANGRTCRWREDENGIWHSACVATWPFDGAPSENGCVYCPRCGGRIQVHLGSFSDYLNAVAEQAMREPEKAERDDAAELRAALEDARERLRLIFTAPEYGLGIEYMASVAVVGVDKADAALGASEGQS